MKVRDTEETIRLGHAAKRLLEDQAVLEVLDDMRNNLHHALDQMRVDNESDAMAIVRQLRVIRTFKTKLENYVATGESEMRRLEWEKENA